jgi:ribulose-phosphate 3-epimerase
MAIVAPSILAADWKNLEFEIQSVAEAGADWIHLDVMDGQFVPPITFGPKLVEAAKSSCSLPLDVHLMIQNPEAQIEVFAAAGADTITVHLEACPHIHRVIQEIKSAKVRAGVAINPGTPVSSLLPILEDIDLALIMTVNPGWGGQKFIESSISKIKELKDACIQRNLDIDIEVDGGVDAKTGARAVRAGANVLVAGTSVFGTNDRAKAIGMLKKGGTLSVA